MFCNDKRFYIEQIDQKNSVLFLRLGNDQEKLINIHEAYAVVAFHLNFQMI